MWLQCNLLSRQRICAISLRAATICHVAFAPLRLRACLLQILTVSDAAFREPSAGLSARSSFICIDEDSTGLARLNFACLFVCLFVRFVHGWLADSQFPLCACLSACASASASASGNFATPTLFRFVGFSHCNAELVFRFHSCYRSRSPRLRALFVGVLTNQTTNWPSARPISVLASLQ